MATSLSTCTITFDFSSAAQQAILSELQQQGYSMLLFLGVEESCSAQTPIWQLLSCNDIFGVLTLTYVPQYKVYVTQNNVLGAASVHHAIDEVGKSSALSNVVPLGTSLVFNQNGSFTTGAQPAPAGAISLLNNATASTQVPTTGLAASIDGVYSPFSACSIAPTTTVIMAPTNNVFIGLAQLAKAVGSVTTGLFSPGALTTLTPGQSIYSLTVVADTYAVIGAGSTNATTVPAAQMSQLATGS